MPRNLGYRDVWENCYRSTFGKEAAMRYGERFYCQRGRRIDSWHGQFVNEPLCPDWHKCKGLDQVLNRQVKRAN